MDGVIYASQPKPISESKSESHSKKKRPENFLLWGWRRGGFCRPVLPGGLPSSVRMEGGPLSMLPGGIQIYFPDRANGVHYGAGAYDSDPPFHGRFRGRVDDPRDDLRVGGTGDRPGDNGYYLLRERGVAYGGRVGLFESDRADRCDGSVGY